MENDIQTQHLVPDFNGHSNGGQNGTRKLVKHVEEGVTTNGKQMENQIAIGQPSARAAHFEYAQTSVKTTISNGQHKRHLEITEARLKGYEGDMCGECGQFTMVRNGTCLKCDTCGATSGCS
jgi:hypothetical protein